MTYSRFLYHSKGPWKKHKYLRKWNGRYIYKTVKRKVKNLFNKAKNFCKKYFDKALNALASSAVQFGFNMLDGMMNYNMYVYDANGNIVGQKKVGDYLVSEISTNAVNYVKTNDQFRNQLLSAMAKEGANAIANDPKIQKELIDKVASEGANLVRSNSDQIVKKVTNAASNIKTSDIENIATQGWSYLQDQLKKKR